MMFDFLLKGIIRDRRRSLLPVIVITIGVMFMVVIDGIVSGMMNNMIEMTASYQTGHLKVMSRAYQAEESQKPNDLALLETGKLLEKLRSEFPEVDWSPRILFGGILDIPDANGETKAQGPVAAQAANLLSPDSRERERLNLDRAIVKGSMITNPGEVLVSVDFATRFDLQPGDTVTFFGSTMYGAMSFANYRVTGMLRFGNSMLDQGGVVMDLEDARRLLDMSDAAGEVFGFFKDGHYEQERAERIKMLFNGEYAGDADEYAPVMLQLADQDMMSQTLRYTETVSLFMVLLLMLALSIVLWNTGVLGGIRRYNEFGVRLAMGEEKSHIYRTLLAESLLIGVIGAFLGTLAGLLISLMLKYYGLDYSSMMENVSMMLDPVIRSEITPRMYFIGAFPGILSMLIGTALAGRAVYRRNTAMLFKELD